MAVDTFLQRSVLGIMQALFDAAPGAHLYYLFSQVTAQGMSLPLLVTTLIKTPEFNSSYTYADSLSTSEFAARFSNDLLGNRATQSDKNLIASIVVGQINGGASRGEAMSMVFGALLEVDDRNPVWGAAAAYYKHQIIDKILDNLLGDSTAVAKIKSDLTQGMINAAIQNGTAIADLVPVFISVLDSIPDTDPNYGDIAHRFHNKLAVSGYYSVDLMQSASTLSDLQSVITPVTSNDTTVELARMKADYFTTHSPYSAGTLVVTKNCDISGIDTTLYKTLIIDAGVQSLPRATATLTATQTAAFVSITKGANDRLAVIDSIANINAKAGNLGAADSITGLVKTSVDLSNTNLTSLTGLTIDDNAATTTIVTVTAAQASAFFGRIAKGAGDKLAVVDAIAAINAVQNLSAADRVTGVVSTSSNLSNTDLSRLTDLEIVTGSSSPTNVIMTAAQAKALDGHLVKANGNILTLVCVPSDISTLPGLTDAIICNVTITRDLRTLDLTKCIAMSISDGTATSISATLLAKQAQSLSGLVTKGMSDRLIVDDTPANVLAATDLSVADIIYATDLSGNTVTISEPELSRITTLRTAGKTVLTGATSNGLPQDVAKISISGGSLWVNTAPGNFTVALATMATIASLTAQSGASITLTGATNAGLPSALACLHVSGGGQVHVVGATGENLVISESGLASVGSLIAAPDASIALTDVTGAGLSNDLLKLKVSGTGGISFSGAFDESFNLGEGILLSLKSLTTKGAGTIAVSDVHGINLADILDITGISGTGSVSITGATGENLSISSATILSEPISSVTAATNQSVTLLDANAATLSADMAKLHVSGTGKINILGASGQNLSFTETGLGSFGTIAATGAGNITITDVTAANLANDLAMVSVASGIVNILLASGQAPTLTQSQLLKPVSITAAGGDSIWLTGATGASLTTVLSKLHVSAGGSIDVTGALNENLSLVAAGLASVSYIHTTGSGNITITDASAANVPALLNKLSILGTGTASLTFTDAATAFVSASASNNRKIIAGDTNGSITITNDTGKQTFYASAGATGNMVLVTKPGDSTSSTSTCDVLTVISSGTTMVGLAAISSDDTLWNVSNGSKATGLNGAGLVLDPTKYDTYIATVGGSDFLVYETAVNGSTYEAIKLIGTVTPATLQMNAGILYL